MCAAVVLSGQASIRHVSYQDTATMSAKSMKSLQLRQYGEGPPLLLEQSAPLTHTHTHASKHTHSHTYTHTDTSLKPSLVLLTHRKTMVLFTQLIVWNTWSGQGTIRWSREQRERAEG